MSSDSRLAHHFKSLKDQTDAIKLGTWLFLFTEVIMFGTVLVSYFYYHSLYSEMFSEGATFLNWKLGALNTVVLLTSSFTMVAAIYFLQVNKKKLAEKALLATFAFGVVFLIVKYLEYSHKFHMDIFPGKFFAFEGAVHDNLALYFSFYFMLTGIHGLHVLIGMGVIFWMYLGTRKGTYDSTYYAPVEAVGLFWHLVDLVWIYLFPLLYLVG